MKTFRWHIRIAFLWIIVLLFSESLRAAGERTNIRGIGMGRTFVASSQGLDAVGVNPANLPLEDRGTVEFSLLQFGFHVGSDLFNYDLYNKYFTGVPSDSGRVARYLSETDKQDILSRFNGGVARSMVDVEARLLGLSLRFPSVGTFAFTVSEQIGAYVDLPKDYAEFIFYGTLPGKVLDFSETSVKGSWTREYTLAFGTDIPARIPYLESLTGGIAVKMVKGYAYYEVERFNSTLATADNGVLTANIGFLSRLAGADLFNNGIDGFPEPVGQGFGVDLGVSGRLNSAISFGLSMTNIGSIRWDKGVEEIHADTVITIDDPLDPAQRDQVERSLTGERRVGEAFSTSLPTTLRLGVALKVNELPVLETMPGELLLAMDYNQGLTETPTSSTRSRVSLGMEYRLVRWFPIRAGISVGGTDHLNCALGFGLNFGIFDLDVGSENVGWLFNPDSFSRGSLSIGMLFRI